jgi:hypothetical protein
MEIPGFVGPSNTLASPLADCERTVNLFTERTEPGTATTPAYLRGTPGIVPFASCGDSPLRGLFAQDGRCFAVAGTTFVEIDTITGAVTPYGPVATDTAPVSMASNGTAGHQILVISGGFGYIFDLVALTLSAALGGDFPATARMCAFMDGYFLVLVFGTRRFQISALEDGTSWDALDVAERSEGSDDIVTLIRNHREIWLMGTQTSEVWYDTGDPLFPFAPVGGVFVEAGSAAAWGAVRADNTLIWLDRDERGAGIVRRADGYTPARISTYAVERALAAAPELDRAQAFAEQTEGHLFYWLYIPGLETTWVYDVGEGLWHERALWDPVACVFAPHVAVCHAFVRARHLVGDRQSDTVYHLTLTAYADEVVVP